VDPLEEWRIAQSWPNAVPALKPTTNLHPTPLQQVWATPYAGALVQGGIIDPVLGAAQLGGHLIGAEARALGRPELDPSQTVDRWVDHTEGKLDQALRATGTSPTTYEIGRTAGAIGSALLTGPLGVEAEAGLIAKGLMRPAARAIVGNAENKALRNAAVYGAERAVPGAAQGAVRSVLLDSIDTRAQNGYWASKARAAASGVLQGATADPIIGAWAKKAVSGIAKASPQIGGILQSTGLGQTGHATPRPPQTPDYPFDSGNAPTRIPSIGNDVPGRLDADGQATLPNGPPMGASVPGRPGSDGTQAQDLMSSNIRPGDRALAALADLAQALGSPPPREPHAPQMPPGLFGGYHYELFPDYWGVG
jgi:hypothetical protein